ncbi:hypothetical protein NHX12_021695 [Muraenolepis orangiensis]|uniref:Uncharacterized protein n=1 Tax=Muraenolepis orangiensis TaxID=630683 RepID=A0A9Q0IW99_9TELE|nr:hypothetical protein NHX12_021695 [Muraenolepis orangiensis]
MSPCCYLRSLSPSSLNPFGGGSGSGSANTGEGTGLSVTSSSSPGDRPDLQDYTTSRVRMDIAMLRERYRWTRDQTLRNKSRVVVFRRVSEDLTEAVRVITVTQGLDSLWESNNSVPPDLTLLPVDPVTPDPWHVHLDLHRRINGPAAFAVIADALPGDVHSAEARGLDASPEGYPRDEGVGCSLPSTPGGYPVGRWVNGVSGAGPRASFDDSYTLVGSSVAASACGSVADPSDIGEYHKPRDGGYGPACHTFGEHGVLHPAPTPTGLQMKSIKKSETAMKLGMYSLF